MLPNALNINIKMYYETYYTLYTSESAKQGDLTWLIGDLTDRRLLLPDKKCAIKVCPFVFL